MDSRGDIATRFSPTRQPSVQRGRTNTMWLRERLNKASRSGSTTEREAIVDHLIEIATSWDVRIVGKGSDGELLKVASGRDAVEAAKLLLGYDMGSPARMATALEVAEHFRGIEKDRIATVIALLGHKLRDKTPEQIAAYFDACASDHNKFLDMASQALGNAEESAGAQGESQEKLPESESKP